VIKILFTVFKAVTKVKEVAMTINEKKREAESFVFVVDIYNRLEPKIEDLCQPHRRLLKEGLLTMEGKQYYCVLFNDLFLQTKESGDYSNHQI
jgi:hypothetical protein